MALGGSLGLPTRPDAALMPVASGPRCLPVDLDEDSRSWVERLGTTGREHREAVEALFELLHRATRHEAHRRRASLPPEVVSQLDDLARQAAGDALVAVLGKLDGYRGASRFTTWAWKFAIFEVSAALRRAAWHGRAITIDDSAWQRLADSSPGGLGGAIEARELLAAIHRSVAGELTTIQREVFVAVVVLEVPVDVVAGRRGTTRGAIYKALHDARRKLRVVLAAQGWAVDDRGDAER
jgi:RNA polymerase sigma-70 factor, ECF subfamily